MNGLKKLQNFRISLLHRYMFREILFPFFFGVVAFSVIIAGGSIIPNLVNEAQRYNLAFSKITALFLLRMPGVIALTFPMATLLSTLLSFSRLSSESELTAFRAGGLSLYKLVAAPLFFGFLVSLLTICFNELIVPYSSFMAENTIIQLRDIAKAAPQIQKNVNIPMYENNRLVRMIHAQEMEGSVLRKVNVIEYDQGDNVARSTRADEAEYDAFNGWTFRRGTLHQFAGDNRSALIVDFVTQNINLSVQPRDIFGRNRDPDQMNIAELAEYIQRQSSFGANVLKERVLWQQKLAVPFACLIFVLLGSQMGIRPQRSGAGAGLGISVLVIFLYYVLLTLFMWFGQRGFSPFLAAWLPNLLIGVYGFYGLYKKAGV
ncbi:lipopolysaccharide ABC transporter permease protein [Candidatus Termititenax persephonae]|uniref:Lipopolysaccharide ABC transporter permease protein n=1 Tax=Candidatus Termititenax persephonae TaxID=2218525 RepID=A0A388TIA5_9BACT|nr:lipopolysaccharide ABC transporter permease protein [Candidatus Termititenax persephonae]